MYFRNMKIVSVEKDLVLMLVVRQPLNLQMQKLMKIFLMKTRMKKMKREAGRGGTMERNNFVVILGFI